MKYKKKATNSKLSLLFRSPAFQILVISFSLAICVYIFISNQPKNAQAVATAGYPSTEVDPSDTDDYVNAFILNQVKSGYIKTAAGGAWWGLTTNASQNQIWTVNRKTWIGTRYDANLTVESDFACIMPGKLPGKGTSRNTLSKPTVNFHMFPNNLSTTPQQAEIGPTTSVLEQFYKLRIKGVASGSQEIRTNCHATETVNEIATGRVVGERIQANVDFPNWFGVKSGTPWGENDSANHNSIATGNYDFLDSHAWYTGLEYVFNIIQNPLELMGKTVKGNIYLKSRVQKSGGTGGSIHHRGLKIEINNKDYWVEQYLTDPTGNPLALPYGSGGNYQFLLVTTAIPDGWHILSLHSHAIDKSSMPGHLNMQLAAEIKIPICVNNTNTGKCP